MERYTLATERTFNLNIKEAILQAAADASHSSLAAAEAKLNAVPYVLTALA